MIDEEECSIKEMGRWDPEIEMRKLLVRGVVCEMCDETTARIAARTEPMIYPQY